MERFQNLDDFYRDCWNKLFRGVAKRGEAFRLPVLATTDGKQAYSRVIVLREVDTQTEIITGFTDIRSEKVGQIKLNPYTSWTFWAKNLSLQIRAEGKTVIHHGDAVARQYWDKIAPKNRKDYCSLNAPSSSLEGKSHPDIWEKEEELTAQNTEYGFENFAVIKTQVKQMDALHLHRAGHQRAGFKKSLGEWKKEWLTP